MKSAVDVAAMLRNLAMRLTEYCGEGTYAYLLDRPSTVPVDSPLVVFDTRRCPQDVLRPVMFAILEYVTATVERHWSELAYHWGEAAVAGHESEAVASALQAAERSVAVAFLGVFVVFLGLVAMGPVLARPLARVLGRPLPTALGVTGTLARGRLNQGMPRGRELMADAADSGVRFVARPHMYIPPLTASTWPVI